MAEEDIKIQQGDDKNPEGKKPKHHLIKITWLRRTLKTLCGLIIFIIILPFLIYVPPIQTFLKNEACKIIYNSTGMKVEIDKLRLKFPLDLSLQKVSVVEATGDTMVRAREVIADVKLLPLLKLDVKVNKLKLNDAYYRMVSKDTSMLMTLNAGYLEVDDKSSMNIKTSQLALNKATLRDADIRMYMDVWKKKQEETPPDTTKGMVINIGDLEGERIRFGMSMLPTIDTLSLYTTDLTLKNGIINLEDSKITADILALQKGSFEYLTPTEEYIKTHPAPIDTMPPGPPMVIEGKDVSLKDFTALYAVKGAKPKPGFDAGYIDVSGVSISLENFFNSGSTLRLPIKAIAARERCGLEITEGSGLVELDSLGINITPLKIRTPYSRIDVEADLPFELMELKPNAPVNVNGDLSLGLHDINCFMPSLKEYTKYLPANDNITLKLDATGTLNDVDISKFDLDVAKVLTLKGSGHARDPMNFKNMVAQVNLEGSLQSPSVAEKFIGNPGFSIPTFTIKGDASIDRQTYAANLTATTSQGDVAAKGRVNLNSEVYEANVSLTNVNVKHFMPDLGIGHVTATVYAKGDGFNPINPSSSTDVDLKVTSIEYQNLKLNDITAQATLANHNFDVVLNSPNPGANLGLDLKGSYYPDKYALDGTINARDINLKQLGLDTATNNGHFDIYVNGTASPNKWLYDVTLNVRNFDWHFGSDDIQLPDDINAYLLATSDSVSFNLDCQETGLSLTSGNNLPKLVNSFLAAAMEVETQISERELIMDAIQQDLPDFTLNFHTPGSGLVEHFLAPTGIAFDTVFLNLHNDSILTGNAELLGLYTEKLSLDTITLGLSQRNSLLDYRLHLGNQPGVMDEFHNVNLNGYIGSNRISAYLNQQNLAGETGYKLGLTAALMDTTLTVHFTPLNAMIGYRPWKLNANNYIDLNTTNYTVDADLEASSNESAILLQTRVSADDQQELHLKLTDIRVQDFLNMSVSAPPLTATVNSDIRARYNGKELVGMGRIGITQFSYDNMQIDDINLALNAAMDGEGTSDVAASLLVDKKKALTLSTKLVSGEEGMQPDFVKLNLDRFPLDLANPFLGNQTAQLHGYLDGDMDLTGKLSSPHLNGYLKCDSVAVFLPIMGSSLYLDNDPLTVDDNLLVFDNFSIRGQNNNPLTINGTVDARSMKDIILDITANANNFQVVNSNQSANSEIYGKLFVNLNASAKGHLTHFDANANLTVLNTTNIFYTLGMGVDALETQHADDVVKFVNLNDTVQSEEEELPESVFMKLTAGVSINPGAMVTVNLSTNGTDKVQLSPSGTLSLYRNFMGDITLNGQLNLGQGFARYNVPVIGQKQFDFDPGSYVLWNGPLMNPTLNIKATDQMKVSVVQTGGNSHLVNFLVGLSVTNNLASPKILFDLSTNDDLAIENQLQGMTAEQRNSTAMNLLITGQYSNGDFKSTNTPGLNNVYNFLAQQVNSWAAKNIKGVDLSFGVDQYNTQVDGQNSSAMSYSYQLSKSLFNNKFKISVGGNYSTDDSPDDNLTQNLISDISFEYILRQTNTQTMYVRLFRHNGYESILEGEITEMGAGFVYKRKIGNIRDFFRLNRRRKKTDNVTTVSTDSVGNAEKGGRK